MLPWSSTAEVLRARRQCFYISDVNEVSEAQHHSSQHGNSINHALTPPGNSGFINSYPKSMTIPFIMNKVSINNYLFLPPDHHIENAYTPRIMIYVEWSDRKRLHSPSRGHIHEHFMEVRRATSSSHWFELHAEITVWPHRSNVEPIRSKWTDVRWPPQKHMYRKHQRIFCLLGVLIFTNTTHWKNIHFERQSLSEAKKHRF